MIQKKLMRINLIMALSWLGFGIVTQMFEEPYRMPYGAAVLPITTYLVAYYITRLFKMWEDE